MRYFMLSSIKNGSFLELGVDVESISGETIPAGSTVEVIKSAGTVLLVESIDGEQAKIDTRKVKVLEV